MGVAFIGFGLLSFVNSALHISWMAILLRFVQGAASGCINTTAYQIAANEYSDQVNRLVGLLEMTAGLGCAVGPVIGTVLYAGLGYAGTFYVFGGLNIVIAFILFSLFPKDKPALVKSEVEETQLTTGDTEVNLEVETLIETPVTFFKMLKVPRFLMASLIPSLAFIVISFWEPILA